MIGRDVVVAESEVGGGGNEVVRDAAVWNLGLALAKGRVVKRMVEAVMMDGRLSRIRERCMRRREDWRGGRFWVGFWMLKGGACGLSGELAVVAVVGGVAGVSALVALAAAIFE